MQNNLMTNCCNCGAVMEYSKQNYGSMYKCPYCGTEHHIDLLGRIEEYKVKFMFMGHLIEAYLQSFSSEPIYIDSYRDMNGQLINNRIAMPLKFEFIGELRDID